MACLVTILKNSFQFFKIEISKNYFQKILPGVFIELHNGMFGNHSQKQFQFFKNRKQLFRVKKHVWLQNFLKTIFKKFFPKHGVFIELHNGMFGNHSQKQFSIF